MNRAALRSLRYGFPGLLVFAAVAFSVFPAYAQTDNRPGFWVTSSAEVHATPDQAIVYMMIRSSAPLSLDALTENSRKTEAVGQALDSMGLKGKYRFSADHFGPLRTGQTMPYGYPPQPQLIEVSKYIFVTFEAADISDPHFDQTVAGVIDQITKSGAVQADTQQQPVGTAANAIVYTVKNPEPSYLEATRQAADKAKSTAQETAKALGVTMKGIIDVRINRPLAPPGIVRQPNITNPLDELHLQYYSASKDGIVIQATVTAEYAIVQ
jgi:uncharacterized protein YggE